MVPGARGARFQEPTGGVRLIAGADRVGLCGRFPEVSRHCHAAPALVIGVDGPIRFLADRNHESRAAFVDPGFTHALDTRGGRLAVFLLPPQARRSDRSAPVRDLGRPAYWINVAEAVFRQQLRDFSEIDQGLTRERVDGRDIDERLRTAVDLLADSLEDNVSIEEVAAIARLSPSRLMTLAHEQLGASLRVTRRWLRALRVARDYAAGASLTEAALAAGFSSSAHLSAAARQHFGIRPSDILTPANRKAIRTI